MGHGASAPFFCSDQAIGVFGKVVKIARVFLNAIV
jgi:hypothetical protein